MAGSLQPTSISYAFTVRVRIQNRTGKLAEILSAIGSLSAGMGSLLGCLGVLLVVLAKGEGPSLSLWSGVRRYSGVHIKMRIMSGFLTKN